MLHHLSIDLETYSSISLAKAGAPAYIQSPDFEILLLAYSLDEGAVELVDLASGETLPVWLSQALSDPNYQKHAYNAPFEHACLSKFWGKLPVDQWRCTMLQGLYCGYPAGLDGLGKALGLPSDKQKLTTGKSLIRYFCVPCAPTKVNGGRRRNLPHHDPERWTQFRTYCAGDVITELEIRRRLVGFPVHHDVQQQWELDLIQNQRGVAVDLPLVHAAARMGELSRKALYQEAVSLSGLENPNSIPKLTAWLDGELGESLGDLRKDTVSRLLENGMTQDAPRRMLEIRQALGKTSTRKYNAIESAVCEDGRVRGLLQFYGANRTGRWTGRLVQVQNLPRTYIDQLSVARELIKAEDAAGLAERFGGVEDTLSQMIRTAFVSSPGNLLVDADYAAIEARVLAWLAGEQWRLEVFRTHGKIYEASAAAMFHVQIDQIVKGNPAYVLRQQGKVAELALGYQGSTGALVGMGALEMGLTQEELPEIVARWRGANRRIQRLWYAMESGAIAAVQTGKPQGVNSILLAREIDHGKGLDFLTILLPSGRKLFYANPVIGENRWGKPALSFDGVDLLTRTWKRLETYGGKLVENVVQAIARDCLAVGMQRLESAGYPVVFHVHDEVIVDCPQDRALVEPIATLLSTPMPWAPDLPLKAEGWVGEFYKKD